MNASTLPKQVSPIRKCSFILFHFLLIDVNPLEFCTKSNFYINLVLYKSIVLMEGWLTTLHLVDYYFTGLYQLLAMLICMYICNVHMTYIMYICTWNVWHIQIGSGLIQPALGKWCCLSSFTTPDTWLLQSHASSWFPWLSLILSKGFFDSECCKDERLGRPQTIL